MPEHAGPPPLRDTTATGRTMVLRGGTVIDEGGTRTADVVVRGNMIMAVGGGLEVEPSATELDCSGCWITPGLVDLHVHLRQPGGEEAETVETGSRAAATGGYTAVVAMPNTTPAMDCVEIVRQVRSWGIDAGLVDVHPSACITLGRAGAELVDFGALYAEGIRIFTDDGNEVEDASLMRAAFEATVGLAGAVLGQHSECAELVAGGHLHEGAVSAALGLAGRPAEAEEITVGRDIALARLTGGRLHVLHASTARTVAMIAAARAEGLAVTVEVTPQHLSLTADRCLGGDPIFKVNPPLRTETDVAAMRAGLAAGTVDAVATDHAPHAPHTKLVPFADAPPGMVGLETAVGVVLTELVHTGLLTPQQALATMSWRPARIAALSRHGRPISPGEPANLAVIDPQRRWTVDPHALTGRSRNTPFGGRELRGKVRHTVLEGTPTVIDETPQR